MKLMCEMIVASDIEHLQQIYTGFSMLHQKGFLRLKQTIPAKFLQNKTAASRWTDYKYFNTRVILNNEITITYHTHDWNWIDESILSDSDFYFKRSFDPKYISQLKERQKVFPLGLNYQVFSSSRDRFSLQRSALLRQREIKSNCQKSQSV